MYKLHRDAAEDGRRGELGCNCNLGSDSSFPDRAEVEGYEVGLQVLDMYEEAIYHSGAFDGIYRDAVGGTDILEEFFS